MRFHIRGNLKDAEWVCNEISNYMHNSLKARLLTHAKILSKNDEEIVFEVQTRPALMLNRLTPDSVGRGSLEMLLNGILTEKAPGAWIEKVESV